MVSRESDSLPYAGSRKRSAYRLVNSKFPPIALFDDVASADEFEAIYEVQALTNPRLRNIVGNLNLIALDQIPFDSPGCSYAIAPFTHVNPDGSRFSAGDYGVLYLADKMDTALSEVVYHQTQYWGKVEDLKFDRFVFRGLQCEFSSRLVNATALPYSDPIYDPDSYSQSQVFGKALQETKKEGLRYRSVRAEGQECYALFSPRSVHSIVQSEHFEMTWKDACQPIIVTSLNEVHYS